MAGRTFTNAKFLKEASYVLMMPVFCIPALAHVILHQHSVWYLIASVCLCLPLCIALLNIRNRVAFCVLFLCLMALSGTEMFFAVGQKCMVQTAHVRAIFSTTRHEASHFLDNNFWYMASTVPQLVCGIAVLAIRCLVPWEAWDCGVWRRAALWTGMLCSGLLGAVWQIVPYNIMKCSVLAVQQGVEKLWLIPRAEGMRFNAARPKTEGREYYVMCVGESLRAANMGINGYDRETTPQLQEMGNVVSFRNFYSTATLTLYSVPMMVTRATVDEYNLNYTEYGILKPFKECGFKTFVLSPGKLLTYEEYLTRGADSVFDVRNDFVIPELIDSLTRVHEKVFFLVQLYQSHCYFANFTPEFDVYHPNLVSDEGAVSKDLLLNAYDNTVLTTDDVMCRIIRAIDKPEARATFLFASDHGEVLDMDKPRRGGVLNPDRVEYHVGALFWSNDKWNAVHPDEAERIRSRRDAPVNGDYLFYTACDMADIVIDRRLWKPELSLMSKDFRTHVRKVLMPDGLKVLSEKAD